MARKSLPLTNLCDSSASAPLNRDRKEVVTFRLYPADRRVLVEAASRSGETFTDFVTGAALERAARMVGRELPVEQRARHDRRVGQRRAS